jgi:hypothetical protein
METAEPIRNSLDLSSPFHALNFHTEYETALCLSPRQALGLEPVETVSLCRQILSLSKGEPLRLPSFPGCIWERSLLSRNRRMHFVRLPDRDEIAQITLITLIRLDSDPFPDSPNLGASPISPDSLHAFVSPDPELVDG